MALGAFDKRRQKMTTKNQGQGNAPIAQSGTSPTLVTAECNISPENLRLSQNFAETLGVKKALITVPVRKPNKQEHVRTHPSDDYRMPTLVLELKQDRETYLVDPALWPALAGELIPKLLISTMNRQGVLTLWPVRLPGDDGRLDDWNASALEAAERAKKCWVRVVANMSLGAYEVYEATGDLPDPEWPNVTFTEILNIAFKGRYITDAEHPVLRRLRGEV
jgi:hypothetical protein